MAVMLKSEYRFGRASPFGSRFWKRKEIQRAVARAWRGGDDSQPRRGAPVMVRGCRRRALPCACAHRLLRWVSGGRLGVGYMATERKGYDSDGTNAAGGG